MSNDREIFERNYERFVNLIMNRRPNNQHRGFGIYNLCIRPYMSDEQAARFTIEHSHYVNDEFTPDEFGKFLSELLSDIRDNFDDGPKIDPPLLI